ncbi:hypothetical protein M758_UG042900 [Ceratodon purpureus]|nr:hypothetical protein M758_UG042900 [Ceratodon purpureus]
MKLAQYQHMALLEDDDLDFLKWGENDFISETILENMETNAQGGTPRTPTPNNATISTLVHHMQLGPTSAPLIMSATSLKPTATTHESYFMSKIEGLKKNMSQMEECGDL